MPSSPRVLVFSAALFLSAALLFSVEPMAGKILLPIVGGGPSVWNTCMVFFQLTLLGGYAYAHWSTRRLGLRASAIIHLGLLTAAVVALPISFDADAAARSSQSAFPAGALLVQLTKSIGLPFFALSASAPLFQQWFSSGRVDPKKDPYSLYVASNLGSFAAVVAYPLVIERTLGISRQSQIWKLAFIGLASLTACCAGLALRTEASERRGAASVEVPHVSREDRLRWVTLSAIPSSLLLGITTYLSLDVTPIPLFWMAPLALYLLTFMIVFGRHADCFVRWAFRALPIMATATLFIHFFEWSGSLLLVLGCHLLTFLLAALVCHGALAKARPPTPALTDFFLYVSIGGVVGGLFNALVAPALFNSTSEYPLAIVVACGCRFFHKDVRGAGQRGRWELAVTLLVFGIAMVAIDRCLRDFEIPALWRLAISLPPLVFVLRSLERPGVFALALGATVCVFHFVFNLHPSALYERRTFFGILRVRPTENGAANVLTNGTTTHGTQWHSADLRRKPTMYYSQKGPLGDIFEAFDRSSSEGTPVGVVGLGVGTTSAYRRAGAPWTYYEIDSAVWDVARKENYFHYLADNFPDAKGLAILIGDARVRLKESSDRAFGLLVVDAFSSDAIPVHLITREAFELYFTKIQNGGFVAVHISNRYLDIEPILARAGRDIGAHVYCREHTTPDPTDPLDGASKWCVLERTSTIGQRLHSRDSQWVEANVSSGGATWTDEFSDVIGALRPFQRISSSSDR